MSTPVKWYNVDSREPSEAPTGNGGGRCVPPAVRRALAKKVSSGARCRCEVCQESFQIDYCKFRQVSSFKQIWVCADCSRGHNWAIVPR
jgi:hypothetical protein